MTIASSGKHEWWNELRHNGVLISSPVLSEYFDSLDKPNYVQNKILRDRYNSFDTWLKSATRKDRGNEPLHKWCDAVLEGFLHYSSEQYLKGTNIPKELGVNTLTGDKLRPHRILFKNRSKKTPRIAIWIEPPVTGKQDFRTLGTGKGRTSYSRLLEYLRGAGIKLGILTNGIQFRLVYAAPDHDSWAEWDIRSWFEDEDLQAQLHGFLTLLGKTGAESRNGWQFPLLEAIEASRSKQAELATVMGSQIRSAVELLIDRLNIAKAKHPDLLDGVYDDPAGGKATPKQVRDALYQAATRIIMRIVVVLFAEARGLLSRSQFVYENSYGVEGLFETLRKALSNEGRTALEERLYAWYRLRGLFRLIHDGSPHPDLNIQAYGGLLFRPGDSRSSDIVLRAMAVFESRQVQISDSVILTILERLKIGRVKIKQGRHSTLVAGPVDFSDLKTEFIGMMYEGVLDYELKAAEEPLVILNLGQEPVLPLNLLENKSDREVKDLITKLSKEKAQSPASEDSDGEDTEEDSGVIEGEEITDEESVDEAEGEEDLLDENDQRRLRAVEWAKKAAEAAKLVKKKRGEDDYYYQKRLDTAAKKLIIKVLDRDEYYLARWGGTRKGTGTFYTKPGLAIPTTRRTMKPLIYDEKDGQSIPKSPEEILRLKVCDPACGSASFLVAALHIITDALYKSLVYHRKLSDETGKQILTLPFGTPSKGAADEDLIPVPPSDERFEDMVRSRLRRHVVERCLYGVDLNPMAVELARLSLWIETMDPELPFGFLDHKVKCGNSLVGCWFDQFQDYPLAAWLREGGNKDDTERIKDCLKGERGANNRRSGQGIVIEEMKSHILGAAGVMTFGFHEQKIAPEGVHDESVKALENIHQISISQPDRREKAYREDVLGNEHYLKLKEAFDAWCATWFWPADQLDNGMPSPGQFYKPGNTTKQIVRALSSYYRFFHWELEFPDVFVSKNSGFDVVLGNPPWEISKPSSKEFFSNYDPVYRTYGKQDAIKLQNNLFETDPEIEREWLNYCAFFKSMSNWNKRSSHPFGDCNYEDKDCRISFTRKRKENYALHDNWRQRRSKKTSYADKAHPYRHQGSADINLYKMFLEMSYVLLRQQGRIGMICPSGIYTDSGTGNLRDLFIEKSKWEWLFGFENKQAIFDIHRSFKFCPIIVQKNDQTDAIQTAFMRHDLRDWEEKAEILATPYEKSRITIFSPKSKALLELRSKRDIEIVEKVYENSILLGDDRKTGWNIRYTREFDMTNDSALFKPRPWWEEREFKPDIYGRWINPDGDIALPLYEGRMVWLYDYSFKEWIRGKGRGAVWHNILWDNKYFGPQYLMSIETYTDRETAHRGIKVGIRDLTTAVHQRTAVCSLISDFPCGNVIGLITPQQERYRAKLCCSVNSFVYDFVAKSKCAYLHLNYYTLEETPLPFPDKIPDDVIELTMQLNCANHCFASMWLEQGDRRHPYSYNWALTRHERLRITSKLDAIMAYLYGLSVDDMQWILRTDKSDPKGFWRVDDNVEDELRQTMLTLRAFKKLNEVGIEAFIAEDWQFPNEIGSKLGPRFLEWQKPNATKKEIEESWEECEQHAKNILGDREFRKFMKRLKNGGESGIAKDNDSPSEDKQGELKL